MRSVFKIINGLTQNKLLHMIIYFTKISVVAVTDAEG